MNKMADVIYNVLARFVTLEQMGFKPCVRLNEYGHVQDVLAIHHPSQGYNPDHIASMSDAEFFHVIQNYIN